MDKACDAYENGVSESFNSAIVHSRARPIITMLEEIRLFVMQRTYTLKEKARKWKNDVCPSIREKIKDLNKDQRYWGVYPSGLQQFEARYKNQAFSVDIGEKTCSCRAWQLSGIPCLHAVAALAHLNISAESYVSLW